MKNKICWYSLVSSWSNSICYDFEDVVTMLNIYQMQWVIVIGVSTWKIENDFFAPYYYTWSYDEDYKVSEESIILAKKFITKYHEIDKQLLYDITIDITK